MGHSQWNEPGMLMHLPPLQSPGVLEHSLMSMQTFTRKRGCGVWGGESSARRSRLPHLHHGGDFETRIALAGEAAWQVDATAIAADAAHDLALVDVDARHAILVQGEALIAPAAEATRSVFTSTVLANAGKSQALVDVNLLDEPVT